MHLLPLPNLPPIAPAVLGLLVYTHHTPPDRHLQLPFAVFVGCFRLLWVWLVWHPTHACSSLYLPPSACAPFAPAAFSCLPHALYCCTATPYAACPWFLWETACRYLQHAPLLVLPACAHLLVRATPRIYHRVPYRRRRCTIPACAGHTDFGCACRHLPYAPGSSHLPPFAYYLHACRIAVDYRRVPQGRFWGFFVLDTCRSLLILDFYRLDFDGRLHGWDAYACAHHHCRFFIFVPPTTATFRLPPWCSAVHCMPPLYLPGFLPFVYMVRSTFPVRLAAILPAMPPAARARRRLPAATAPFSPAAGLSAADRVLPHPAATPAYACHHCFNLLTSSPGLYHRLRIRIRFSRLSTTAHLRARFHVSVLTCWDTNRRPRLPAARLNTPPAAAAVAVSYRLLPPVRSFTPACLLYLYVNAFLRSCLPSLGLYPILPAPCCAFTAACTTLDYRLPATLCCHTNNTPAAWFAPRATFTCFVYPHLPGHAFCLLPATAHMLPLVYSTLPSLLRHIATSYCYACLHRRTHTCMQECSAVAACHRFTWRLFT